ncbi:hypothetical protein GJ496_007860 [Pomphorhynchus laevis]|nr:hypothetical protein GJ496_007860 [Pomphorhynchus laevis]
MLKHFQCKNGQIISWSDVCDGIAHCKDKSDEALCYCVDDLYPCQIGYNVSCERACNTMGYISCSTYRNWRACEHYLHLKDFDLIDVDLLPIKENYDLKLLYQLVLIVTGVVGLLAVIVAAMLFSQWKQPNNRFQNIIRICTFNKKKSPNQLLTSNNEITDNNEVRYVDMDFRDTF